jgi:hypothetical protein
LKINLLPLCALITNFTHNHTCINPTFWVKLWWKRNLSFRPEIKFRTFWLSKDIIFTLCNYMRYPLLLIYQTTRANWNLWTFMFAQVLKLISDTMFLSISINIKLTLIFKSAEKLIN